MTQSCDQSCFSLSLFILQSTHKNLLEALNRLVVPPSPQMVQASAECCLRPAKDNHSIRYIYTRICKQVNSKLCRKEIENTSFPKTSPIAKALILKFQISTKQVKDSLSMAIGEYLCTIFASLA